MAFGLPPLSFLGYPLPRPMPGHGGLGFRELGPPDRAAILAHLLRLPLPDRALRFQAALSDVALAAHVDRLWPRNGFVIGGFDGPLYAGPFHRPGPIRALLEVGVADRHAEIALSVDPIFRRRGIAGHLLDRALPLLAARGVADAIALTLPGNAAMRALGRSRGARVRLTDEGLMLIFATGARPGHRPH